MKNILPGIKWVFIDIGYTLVDEDDAVEDRIVQIQGVLEDCRDPGDVRGNQGDSPGGRN